MSQIIEVSGKSIWREGLRGDTNDILNQLYVSVLLADIPFSEPFFTPAHSSWIFFFTLASRLDADFDEEEEVDIEGYDDDDSNSQSFTKQESFVSQQQLESEQDSQDVSQFESILLQDLEHSESESEEDDFPFGDGDDEEDEDIEEEEEQMNFSPAGENNGSMNTTGDLSGDEI